MIAGLGRLDPRSVLGEDPHVDSAHAGYDLVLRTDLLPVQAQSQAAACDKST